MATMAEIRAGIAGNLASLDGVQVSPYMLSQPVPPVVWVSPSTIQYDMAGSRGGDDVEMRVLALFPTTVDVESQILLDEMLDPTGARSIKTLVETDATLGGTVDDVHVTEASGYFVYQLTGGPCVGCEWTVRVIT